MLEYNTSSFTENVAKISKEKTHVQTKSGFLMSYRDIENILNRLYTKADDYSNVLSSVTRRELAIVDANMELYFKGITHEVREATAETARVWLSLDTASQQSISSIYERLDLKGIKDNYDDFFPMNLVIDLDLLESCNTDDEYVRFMIMYYIVINVSFSKIDSKVQRCLHYRYVHKMTLSDVGKTVGTSVDDTRKSIAKCLRFIKSKVLCLTAFGSGVGSINLIDFGDNTSTLLIKSGYKTICSVYRNRRVIEANEILSEKQLGNVRKLLVALGYAVSGGVLL